MSLLRALAWLAGGIVGAVAAIVAAAWVTAVFGTTVAVVSGAVGVVAALAASNRITLDVRIERAR